MTDTGWIVVVLVALAAILLAVIMLRRKGPVEAQPHVPVAKAPAVAKAPPHADTSYPQEPLASMVPPIGEVLASDAPLPIDLSGALDENHESAVDPVVGAPPPADALPAEPITISPSPSPVAAPSPEDGDNLLRLKGLGPKIASLLKAEGITRYAQIAAWSDADIADIDAKIGSFAGRPTRDNWVDQARLLAAGDVAGYETKYGKL